MSILISSRTSSVETKPCLRPSPPCFCNTHHVSSGDTRGCCCCCCSHCCCCCCTGVSGPETSAGENAGDVPITGRDNSCWCGTGDAGAAGAGENSGDAPATGVEGSCCLGKGEQNGWAEARDSASRRSMAATAGTTSSSPAAHSDAFLGNDSPLVDGDGDPAISTPPLPVVHSSVNGTHRYRQISSVE